MAFLEWLKSQICNWLLACGSTVHNVTEKVPLNFNIFKDVYSEESFTLHKQGSAHVYTCVHLFSLTHIKMHFCDFSLNV